MATVGGGKLRLARGRENKKAAEKKFHELASVRRESPEAPTAKVTDVIEALLARTKLHRSPETNRTPCMSRMLALNTEPDGSA
jgi:hypothetical protein